MTTAHIEVTDTFAGEANYCWVNRHDIEHPEGLSDLAIVRRVKALIGWNGLRCETSSYGDMIEIRPRGQAMVCFVSWG